MLSLLAAALIATYQEPQPIDAFVASGTHPTVIASGFRFLEGPVWKSDGRLLFSDILGDTIYELRNGKAVAVIKPSQRAIGNTIDNKGRIVTCHQQTRAVTRRERDGSTTVLADKYDRKRLNSPDDVIVRSDGTIYFTDPGFALKPEDRELAFDGVYKISPDGKLELLLKDFAKPNGLCLSPDEKILYVNDTRRRQIRAYDVGKDGSLTNDRLFAYLTGEMAGEANGMKVDAKGNIFCTGPGGIQIFTPQGRYVGVIVMIQAISNFCFGDSDRKTLYITTGQALYRIRLKVAGATYR